MVNLKISLLFIRLISQSQGVFTLTTAGVFFTFFCGTSTPAFLALDPTPERRSPPSHKTGSAAGDENSAGSVDSGTEETLDRAWANIKDSSPMLCGEDVTAQICVLWPELECYSHKKMDATLDKYCK
jgi:hypothetical protein